ncbi:MAG TPA: acyltransferase [Gammaproteobacteria bacterium]|jgi:acetyltransferase-like isoleucine patch superfamily enzyme
MARRSDVFIHELALCESDSVGHGTRIWAYAHVMKDAQIGADCNIGGHAFIESGARIGDRVVVKNGVQIWDHVTVEDDVFIGPNATLINDRVPRAGQYRTRVDFQPTRICRGATIGANATVLCGLCVGAHAFVAAGSVIVKDVPAHGFLVGAPGKRLGWVCTCGLRLDDTLACACGRRFRLADNARELVACD